MATWRSRPGGDAATRWSDWLIAAAAIWIGAGIAGALVIAGAHLASATFGLSGSAQGPHPLAAVFVAGYALLFSPAFSWAGLAVAMVPVWWLLRRGYGGWASFLVLGLVAGAIGGVLLTGPVPVLAAGFGAVAALAFRWIFYRLRPEIFTTR